MNFLYPTLLYGLFLVAIPIIIHLFNFRRPKTVFFTNVKFLKTVKEVTTAKLKVKHLLVLATRILFLIFTVLAFAQPIIIGDDSAVKTAQPLVNIYMDNSYSMQATDQNENLMNIASNEFRKIAALYPLNTKFQFITNDFDGKDQYLVNKEKLIERLSNVSFSNQSKTLDQVLNRAALINKAESGTQNFILSDFQKSTIGNLEQLQTDSASRYFFVTLQPEQQTNVYIDSVSLETPIVRANETNTFNVALKNTSPSVEKQVLVKLIIENQQVGSVNVTVPPASAIYKVPMSFTVNDTGIKSGQVVIEDFPVVFDNNYYFTFTVSPSVKILNIYEDKVGYIEKVFSNKTLFEIESQQIDNLNYAKLSETNLIVLQNLKTIPTSLIAQLKNHQKSGISVVVFPNKDLDIDSYNQLLSSFSIGRISKEKADTTVKKPKDYQIASPPFQHPFYKNIFTKADSQIDMPYAVPTIASSSKGEKILFYKNGSNFLTNFNLSTSKVYLFATPLLLSYTNLPQHSIFVPVMYKMAFESLSLTSKLSYNLQEQSATLILPQSTSNSKTVFSLQKDSLKVIPTQQLVGNAFTFSLPNIDMLPGVYNLNSDEQKVSKLAFNRTQLESIGECYTTTELQAMIANKPNIKIYRANASDDFYTKFNEENIGLPLWKYFILLAVAMLLIESLLLKFYK